MKEQGIQYDPASGLPLDQSYLESGLPLSLQQAILDYTEGETHNSTSLDCLWGELYGSINAHLWSSTITEEQAEYLRSKYLF